jgi:small subunit ribosomal protein S29e
MAGVKEMWFGHQRNYGKGSRGCRMCGHKNGLVRKYGINCCRQCFREYATELGWTKYH